jgi:hypothetical protein
MSVHIWTPGHAGPLDEFVGRLTQMVAAFANEHGLEQAEVRIELVDGSRHVVSSVHPEPGFGFFSFVPYAQEGEEPKRMIVPVGVVKLVEISRPDPARSFGFTAEE